MTKNDLLKFNQKRMAGGGLPELGVISPDQEDMIRRTRGENALLMYEPDKQKLLAQGPAGRYAYEQRFGTRPGEYTTPEERMMLEQRKGPPMGPDFGFLDAVEVKRRNQIKAFQGGNASASLAPNRGRLRQAKPKNPMMYGDKREEPPQTNHPLSGQQPGRYRIGDVEILWDGTQEVA